jgi:signal transduction histidine kinase
VLVAVGPGACGRRALLYQVVDATAEPRIAALRGRWPQPPTFAAPEAPAESAVGPWAEPLAEGRALLVTDGASDGGEAGFWGPGAGAVAVAPVVVAGAWWGFFAVEAVPGSAGWSEVDRLALRTAADAVAAAIERHDGEAALARERSFAARVLSGIAQGVVVSDADGRISYANPALLAMVGRPIEAVRGRRLRDFAAPAATDLVGRGELVLVADGARRHVLVTESETVGDGRLAVVTDISERSRLEADLKLAAALAEAANDAKTRFLALVSHELRTPLNAIVGFAQLAALDADSPDLSASLRQIHGAGRHLGALIDDLLDLASAETGDLKVEFERVDLSEIAVQALRLVAPLAEAAALELQSSLPGPLFVVADPRRATQVALNLLGNAVRYVQPGGRVTLRVVDDAAAGRARLEVEDDGPGIGEAELERLFRPFERLATARDRGGSGIGLALSRVLAERMGGRLSAESEPGRGSRFWLELPRAGVRAPVRPRRVVDSPS